MNHQPPPFWYGPHDRASLRALALSPLSALYALGANARQTLTKSGKAPVPVICIGNFVVGGSGKTPATIRIAKLLRESGLSERPYFLSRGYGGTAKQAVLEEDGRNYHAHEAGDEPLLLARHAPVIIDADRLRGAVKAASLGADMVIMDDGMQNPGIHKDVSIVMIDGATGFGNRRVLPAGPLREPLRKGFERADIFILVGEDETGAADLIPEAIPIFQAYLRPAPGYLLDKDQNYIAFSGIAHPLKFKQTLEELGATTISGWHEFPDHYSFRQEDLDCLISEADLKNAYLITTEKDFVRLRHLEGSARVKTLPVELVIEQEQDLTALLNDKINNAR